MYILIHARLLHASQIGELAGIAVGSTVLLNVLVAGYVPDLVQLSIINYTFILKKKLHVFLYVRINVTGRSPERR